MNKVTALSLLSNAVLVWNSVRFAEVVAGLEATTGDTVAAADLARVSPLRKISRPVWMRMDENAGTPRCRRAGASSLPAPSRELVPTSVPTFLWRRETPGYALKRLTYWNQ
jgi:hypothetical protein